MCSARGTADVGFRVAFERQQLMEPDGIFVSGPPGVRGDPPARPDLAIVVDQREHKIGIPSIDRKQHGLSEHHVGGMDDTHLAAFQAQL